MLVKYFIVGFFYDSIKKQEKYTFGKLTRKHNGIIIHVIPNHLYVGNVLDLNLLIKLNSNPTANPQFQSIYVKKNVKRKNKKLSYRFA